MKKYDLSVEMTYIAKIEVEAESLEEAKQEAYSMAGDGVLLREAELVDVLTLEDN